VTTIRLVFWLTLIPGVLSVASFALLVRDDRRVPNPTLRFWGTIRPLPARFRGYLRVVGLFGAGDFAHTLLILAATQVLTPTMGVLRAAQVAGLLYVLRNVVQTLASYPIGALADRHGHRHSLVIGYALGALMATLMAVTFALDLASVPLLALIFVLAGLYIAIQEALEAALTASYVPEAIRSVSYGVRGSVNGLWDLISSAALGFLWTAFSPVLGFGLAAVLMTIGTLAMARLRDAQPGPDTTLTPS
jgi:MFS family permease